jgi:hypothetical protein
MLKVANMHLGKWVEKRRPTQGKIKGMPPMQHKSLTRLMFAGANRSGLAPVSRHSLFLSMLIPAPFDITLAWSAIHGRG